MGQVVKTPPPVGTPMFHEDLANGRNTKTLTQAWITHFTKPPDLGQAVFDITNTTVGEDVILPWPVLQGGPAIDITVVNRLVPTADLVLVFKRIRNGESEIIGSITLPDDSPAYTVVSVSDFDIRNLAFLPGDVLAMDIEASDGTSNALGVARAIIRWNVDQK